MITGTEAAERDANTREQEAINQEKRSQALEPEASNPLLRRPITLTSSEDEEEEDDGEAEEEAAVDEALMPPPSTAPARLQVSRAGRKRAPTMKALEAETASKRGKE